MHIGDFESFNGGENYFASILQYPDSEGSIKNIELFLKKMALQNTLGIVAGDLLSLTLLKPPGEMGADVVVGSTQNFGLPLFFGGPHSAFFATRKKFIRLIPGRIAGVSKDRHNKQAYRLSLQTREQHIRRERATSNICTSQALPAVMSSFYAIYHGPEGLKKIALKINDLTKKLYNILQGFKDIKVLNQSFFDTLSLELASSQTGLKLYQAFHKEKINLGWTSDSRLSLSLDESAEEKDVLQIQNILEKTLPGSKTNSPKLTKEGIPKNKLRVSSYLTHPVFNSYHSETELIRYIYKLQAKELSLTHSMIPLGSCTMKLNSAVQLNPVSWPSFANIHPFAPKDQAKGYQEIIKELEKQLCELTGFKAFSFQPNAGSQGEYAGLLAIKKYHESRKESHRKICLIPSSAHGTNPASAIMAGFQVVSLICAKGGGIDEKDLSQKLKKYGKNLAVLMLTYPSTYGFFEEGIKKLCHKIHDQGGLVYLDGANMNALLGLCKPARLGFDVCHLNLHKSFCIPHGGGGPGAGPVGVNEKLKNFLPGHCFLNFQNIKHNTSLKADSPDQISQAKQEERKSTKSQSGWQAETCSSGAVSSAPYGNAGVLIISWAYIKLMGLEGLRKSAMTAIANANYIAEKLKPHYRIFWTGSKGFVAHECIIDLRKFKNSAEITVEDVAKRLMDYGFHAPTMSWPVAGTLMIEPTESENKQELDRFCSALISIRQEIREIEQDKSQSQLLKSAPHTLEDAMQDKWPFPYSKQKAFYPLSWIHERKFWTPVSRIDQAHGDIHPFCSCPPVS